jgi:hypothetical protein
MRVILGLLALLFLLPRDANAIAPAYPEQYVCSASHILLGYVLKATSDNAVHLTVRVDKILGVADRDPRFGAIPIVGFGDILTADSPIPAAFDFQQGPHFPGFKVLTDGPRQIFDNDNEVLPLFLRKELLIAVDMQSTPSPWANVWYPSETYWVQHVFSKCKR